MGIYDPRGGGNVHIDVVLQNISVGYKNNDFVGDALFPSVPVKKQSDKYYVYGRESWGVDPGGDVRAPGTVANEIPGLALSTQSYFAIEHSLQISVTDEERENADAPLEPFRDGTELVTAKLHLAREIAIMTKVTTAGNFASGHSVTLSGGDQWSDYTNSDPIDDIKVAARLLHSKLFLEPNVMVIPYQVMSILEDHPDFIERIKYSERGILTREIISALFGISNILVPGAGNNTANPGQAVSVSYLWGKDVLVAYVPERAGMKIPAMGYEFCWTYSGSEQAVERWREESRKSDVLRVSRRYDIQFTTLDSSSKALAGYVIKAAVA